MLLYSILAPLVASALVDLTKPLSGTTYSQPMSASYVSLNIEWTSILDAFGTSGAYNLNPFPVNLINTLSGAVGGGNNTAVIRLGGNSASYLWFQGSKQPRLPHQTIAINTQHLQLIQQFAVATGVSYSIDVSMASTNPSCKSPC